MNPTRPITSRIIFERKLAAFQTACILFLVCLAVSFDASAQTFTSLVGFNQTDGANPYGALAQGVDGNFYGTTQFGGANGQGAVYQVTPTAR